MYACVCMSVCVCAYSWSYTHGEREGGQVGDMDKYCSGWKRERVLKSACAEGSPSERPLKPGSSRVLQYTRSALKHTHKRAHAHRHTHTHK